MHAEIGRLPARYRVPLVLCYLEGLTSEEAARQLGWPAGTVRSRLTRGRERLRRRLVLRGIAPSAAVLAAALVPGSAWAAVPAGLADTTARMAALVAAGRVAAGTVPVAILTLTEGVLHTMAMTKWKMVALALLVSGLLASRALVSAQQTVEPTPSRSEPDRLRSVEGKLDRLLQKLDAAEPRLAQAPVTITAGTPVYTTPREPEATPKVALDPSRLGPSATTAPVPFGMAAEPRPENRDFSYTIAANKGVEQRVAALEDRLAKIEHTLADMVKANRDRATTPETGRPKDDLRPDRPRQY
jgi:hypothetical protein